MIAFDTNVLIYVADAGADRKHWEATRIVDHARATGRVVVLLQSLVEFRHAAAHKLRLPTASSKAFIEGWLEAAPVHAYDADDLLAAIEAVEMHKLAFFDALLWATAARVGVQYLVTEDQQHGRRLGPVTFLSPFEAETRGRLAAA